MKETSTTLEIYVDTVPLRLSARKVRTLMNAQKYDAIVFTSKNAQKIFEAELRKRGVSIPKRKMVRVGPREDLLKLDLAGRHVLFPRSALAPFDIVRKLRARGVLVTPITVYTAHGRKLSARAKKELFSGKIQTLYFKSPSGISGLLRQVSRKAQSALKDIPALCIGETTAKAARYAGWKKVSIKR